MSDFQPILTLWRELEAERADYVLATIVGVEGSSYRRPGARMLVAADGRRAGTVSGGCLEGEVAKRCFWLTESGPAIEKFSTYEEDGERPYGSGCGGLVSILLERRETASALLFVLGRAFEQRTALAIATIVDGPEIGRRALAGAWMPAKEGEEGADQTWEAGDLQCLAASALTQEASAQGEVLRGSRYAHAWVEYRPARPGLWVFSAGDDAKPLVRLARELGWFTAVVDGRAHLATRERFPAADFVSAVSIAALPGKEFSRFDIRSTDAAVVMTHSFEQDSRVIASLLSRSTPLAYIGVLGPQRRTCEMLSEAARLLGMPAGNERVEKWLTAIHAPTGLDLGADTPATIAMSILSEIQQTIGKGTAQPLSAVRAPGVESSHR